MEYGKTNTMIRDAVFPGDTVEVQSLIYEYVNWLNLDLSFQNFDVEMANLGSLFTQPEGLYTLAFSDDEVAGGVGFRRHDAVIAEVKRLFVRPRYRGMGLARALMENLVQRLALMGYEKVILDAVPPTRNAQKLYESMGFQQIEPYNANPIPGTKYYGMSLPRPVPSFG